MSNEGLYSSPCKSKVRMEKKLEPLKKLLPAYIFSVSARNARRIWQKGRAYLSAGLIADACIVLKTRKGGRKRIEIGV